MAADADGRSSVDSGANAEDAVTTTMITRILGLAEPPKPADAADADEIAPAPVDF